MSERLCDDDEKCPCHVYLTNEPFFGAYFCQEYEKELRSKDGNVFRLTECNYKER